MVVPIVEVAIEGELPAPEVRMPLLGDVFGGLRFGNVELGVQVGAGVAVSDSEEWYDGVGVGWGAVGGVRAAVLLPVGPVFVRPVLEAAAEQRLQTEWYGESRLKRYGAIVRVGADLMVATSPDSWIAGSLTGGWSSIDGAARIQVGIRVGTRIARRH